MGGAQRTGGLADIRWGNGGDSTLPVTYVLNDMPLSGSAAPMHVVQAGRVLTKRVLHRYTLRMCRVPMPPAILGLTAPTRPPTMRIAYSGQTARCRLAGLVPGGAYILQFQATGAASQRQSPLPEVVLVSAHSRGAERLCMAIG